MKTLNEFVQSLQTKLSSISLNFGDDADTIFFTQNSFIANKTL